MAQSKAQPGSNVDLTSSAFWESQWQGLRDGDVSARSARRRRKRYGLMRFLREQVAMLDAGSPDVLELGCAPGGILGELHRWFPEARLHGLDYAPQGLAATERFFARLGIPATLHCGDLRQFDPGRKYDVVYSCGLVEHFTDPVPVLRHHARLCRPGGRVVVTVPNYSGPLQEWLMGRLDPEMLRTHNLEVMNPTRLRDLLQEAGLTNVVAGQFGLGKFCTKCSVRNWRTHSLRLAAKTWNAARRVLPITPNWHGTVWAAGDVNVPRGLVAA
jgi:SAM-dependent methyltransferase